MKDEQFVWGEMEERQLKELSPEETYCQRILIPIERSVHLALEREDLVDTIRQLQHLERMAFDELARRLP